VKTQGESHIVKWKKEEKDQQKKGPERSALVTQDFRIAGGYD